MTMVRFEPVTHMTRVVSVVSLLAGAGLLVVWLVTPATSAPPQQPHPPATSLDQDARIVADVNAQVERLRERLTAKVDYPPPSRDLFRFVAPAPRIVAAPSPAVAATVGPSSTPPPRLVAILTQDTDATVTRVAVFADADANVHFLSVGDALDGYSVTDVQDDVVVLIDIVSHASVRLPLR